MPGEPTSDEEMELSSRDEPPLEASSMSGTESSDFLGIVPVLVQRDRQAR